MEKTLKSLIKNLQKRDETFNSLNGIEDFDKMPMLVSQYEALQAESKEIIKNYKKSLKE